MTDPSTDLTRRGDVADLSKDELERFYSIAKSLALSKMFPDATLADEAFTKVLMGRDLGLSPTQSMTGIHIVKGKPQIAATTLAGFVRKSDRYDYRVLTHTDEACSLAFSMDGEDIGHSTFTLAEAKAAGLVKADSGWAKFPRNMLFARAMSNGVKWYAPDLMGGVPVYTEGDVFESTATDITAGTGSGEAAGIELPPIVEAIIERAERLGSRAYERPTVEVMIGCADLERTVDWVYRATHDLNLLEETKADGPVGVAGIPGTGSDVLDESPDPDTKWEADDPAADPDESPDEMRGRALRLLDKADEADAQKLPELAATYREAAVELHARADEETKA